MCQPSVGPLATQGREVNRDYYLMSDTVVETCLRFLENIEEEILTLLGRVERTFQVTWVEF